MKRNILFTLILLTGIFSGCYMPTRATPANAEEIQTAVAQTIVVRKTENAFATLVTALTALPTGTAPGTNTLPGTPLPPPSGTPTLVSKPCNHASLLEDVTIPDDTVVLPNQSFTKIWRFQNIGTCTWSPDYSIFFTEGSSLNAPASVKLNTSVAPGGTVDIAVPMTAPSAAGTYVSNWMFKNAAGSAFGLGSAARSWFWARIQVTAPQAIAPDRPLDFTANMCAAVWKNNTSPIACPSPKPDFTNGSVYRMENPKLEGGYQEDEPAIITIPANGSNGFLRGQYPAIQIQNGDVFRSLIGCLHGSPNCNVLYQLSYIDSNGVEQTLGSWTEIMDDAFHSIHVDLSPMAGQSIQLILTIRNNGSSNDDRAFWVSPRIDRK